MAALRSSLILANHYAPLSKALYAQESSVKEIKAHLISEIPKNRFRSLDGSKPKIGDAVVLDQGITFKDGEAGCLVYGVNAQGQHTFEAEVYETELSN